MPSPDPARPGLLIRDPMHYTDTVLIVPPQLVASLAHFDGESSEGDLRHALFQALGDLRSGEVADQLKTALDEAGFLENESFARLRESAEREFAEQPVRFPAHLGPGGYPEDPEELCGQWDDYLRAARAPAVESTFAVAAPHVSPFGGWESYADAYAAIPKSAAEKTFVVLGTSHHGELDRFGLTRKPYATPYGDTTPALDLIDELERAAPAAVLMEDYCHAVEHSIEFQVVFLQHLFGPKVRVLPILVGSFARSVYEGGLPEKDEAVARFFGALGEIAARESKELFWVMGIDMAHMGRRYGDRFAARADRDEMTEVAERDRARIDRAAASDAPGFWDRVRENRDDLKWCGSAPLYTFLKCAPGARGELLRYQQWNIDEDSVVSFAGMRFGR